MFHKGKLLRFAALHRKNPDLRLALALFLLLFALFSNRLSLTFRNKGKEATIGRPAWATSIRRASGQAPGLTAFTGSKPDRRAVLMLILIDSSYYKGNSLAIGRNTWPGNKFDLIEFFDSD